MFVQSEIFKDSEGNEWYERNRSKISALTSDNDMIFQEVKNIYGNMKDRSYLEIGCSNGFRLSWMKNVLGAEICGVEPGEKAVEEGQKQYLLSNNEIKHGDALQFFRENVCKFDVIVFGHCLYLIPPQQIPEMVAGAIKALKDDGVCIIFDFDSIPQSLDYCHYTGVVSYKTDFAKYFTWVPFMKLIKKYVVQHKEMSISKGDPKEDCALSVIKKIPLEYAFPRII
jgi:2-polyprenyl-3-methyl-5-hydroxy-6-metoxy-1,4-benzoquinol methylase